MGFGFLLSDRSGGLFQLSLADGGSLTVLAQPGGSGGGAGVLIFPNIAALEAFDVSAAPTPVGTLAVVLSNNSVWEFTDAGEGLAVDNITVASSTGDVDGRWQRFASAAEAQYIAQTGWHVDPQAGNDEATGLDAAHPIKTKAEIYRRWGYTWSPNLKNAVVITYASSETDSTDPGFFAPQFEDSASLTHTSPLPAPSFTGTLNVVTAKNRAANQVLEATFTTTTGAVANGMMLVNATRGGSIAWAFEGGPTFVLTQPLAPYAGGDATAVTEVDTWAHGDAISGYALTIVNLALVGGTTAQFAPANVPQHIISHIEVADPLADSPITIDGAGNVAAIEAFLVNSPVIKGALAFTTFANTVIFGVILHVGRSPLNTSFRGGGFGSDGILSSGFGPLLDNDVICGGDVLAEALTVGTAYVDTGIALSPSGGLSSISGPCYGPGSLNVLSGNTNYSAPATTSLPLAGGLKIGGSANAYSNDTPGGVGTATTTNLVAITAAALDAAPGATGFGGLAYIPGVGALTTGAVAP